MNAAMLSRIPERRYRAMRVIFRSLVQNPAAVPRFTREISMRISASGADRLPKPRLQE